MAFHPAAAASRRAAATAAAVSIALLSLFFANSLPSRVDVAFAFAPPRVPSHPLASKRGGVRFGVLLAASSNDDEDEASKLRAKADQMRNEVKRLEESLGTDRARSYPPVPAPSPPEEEDEGMTLDGKRILIVGANGRLGSMVCRRLLRNHPKTEVIAAVHYVGENSPTARGYGRLSYEVGAEDGVGTIGPAWSSEDRTATFQYSDEMKDYNLQNLRVVEVELLDPNQCSTITENVDSVIWCATDFNGNRPRAVSGLNVAFLFRAMADPTKGRVEIEGLRNLLGGLKNGKRGVGRRWGAERTERAATAEDAAESQPTAAAAATLSKPNDPISFVLISASPDAFPDFETPFGTFHGLKREGEAILEEFPSLSSTVLRMTKYDDNFVEEGLEWTITEEEDSSSPFGVGDDDAKEKENEGAAALERSRRRINRRDAARVAVEALTDEGLVGKTVEVWTATR